MSGTSRRLYGELERDGVTLVQHTTGRRLVDYISTDALHIVLNLEGQAIIFGQSLRLSLTAGTMTVFHRSTDGMFSASRLQPDENHHYLILSAKTSWIQQTFGSKREALHPNLVQILNSGKASTTSLSQVRSMSLAERELAEELVSPPVQTAAAPFWYMAKIIEIFTLHLFTPQTLAGDNLPFCSSIKKTQKERIEKCIAWLKDHLDEPLDLKSLAQSIGCATHYLSRQFSSSTGMTLKQKLRQLRIDKATNLLRDGDYNVTEAAMEVGYNSLSHFTKAFIEEKGQKPSDIIAEHRRNLA
ncbi:HTH-type transcriptional activator RhaR [Rubritalea halochordaticola]|uniref:HTH-type transcriptional activator RhaR n=1 Tax=Rubritalea halochordaticola TaxID=714537 RepID=A0ABP9UVX8_9BACT